MANINKIISFVLGLIVVIIILLVLTGKFNILNFRSKLLTVSRGSTKVSPSATGKVSNKRSVTPTRKYLADNRTQTTPGNGNSSDSDNITSIPSTGSSTTLLLGTVVSLFVGIYLLKMDTTS